VITGALSEELARLNCGSGTQVELGVLVRVKLFTRLSAMQESKSAKEKQPLID